MRVRRPVEWLCVVCCTVGIPALASAQDADRIKVAADEFDAGRRAFKSGDFEGAAAHFENADRDAPSPEALLGAMKARREAKQADRAATLAQLALSRYPNEKNISDYARQTIAEGEKSLHKTAISCTPACAVVVDNRVMPGADTASRIIYLEPGPHSLSIGWPGNRHASDELVAVAGGSAQLSYTAPPASKTDSDSLSAKVPGASGGASAGAGAELGASGGQGEGGASPDTGAEASHGLPPVVFYSGLGLTAVLAGVTVWSGLDAQSHPGASAYEQACDPSRNTPDMCQALYDEGHPKEVRTNVLLGVTGAVGLATAIVGAFLTTWGGEKTEAKHPDETYLRRVTPFFSVGNGASIGAVGRF